MEEQTKAPQRTKQDGINYDAIRRRIKMIQKVATKTGHAVITDAEVEKAMHRGTNMHLVDFCKRYGQSIDWVIDGDVSGMIASRIVDAGASDRAVARALLTGLGFIEVTEDGGRIFFIERGTYEKLVVEGKLVGAKAGSARDNP